MTTSDTLAGLIADLVARCEGDFPRCDSADLSVLHDLLIDSGCSDVADAIDEAIPQHGDGSLAGCTLHLGHLWSVSRVEGDSDSIGYHGGDAPPSDAEYIGELRHGAYLTLLGRDGEPECAEGWEVVNHPLDAGYSDSDGTFRFVVLAVLPDGRRLVGGWC